MVDRRAFVIGAASAAVIAARSPASLLDRAIERAGGASALRQARVLRWTGQATVFTGGRLVEIGVSTLVEPFQSARSDTWLLSDGPTKTRSLVIEPQGGWIERDGARTPLPDTMLRHERAQYAVYGLMRLICLYDPGASASAGPAPKTLLARHPHAPETMMGFDDAGRLIWATNTVPEAEGEGTVDQRFAFSGLTLSRGVHWPQRIQIAQHGQPYFDLRLQQFRVAR